MSELREELLGTKIDKKRVIIVILVAALLISAFAFSTVFFSFLFGTQRPIPSKQKANTDYQDVEKIVPPLPIDWLNDIMDFLSPEQLADLLDQISLEDLADLLDQISDGDVDNFDLSNFPEALLALLAAGAGEIEVFRFYNYLDINEMSNILWKYECFDNYDGNEWTSSASQHPFSFYPLDEYLLNYFPDPELLKIKMELSPNIGSNSMVIPSRFPIPFIMDGSVNAFDLDYGSINLFKDDFNSSFLDLTFNSDNDVNMTYELFGLDLSSNDEINNTAVRVTNPTTAYSDLLTQFTQLPPNPVTYINTWSNFKTHYDFLNTIIDTNNDNAFVIANKIRNYLQTQFTFPSSPEDYQSAPEGQDSVDWFCEQGIGVWSDFASAFCVFARAFGVASRFLDGYRTEAFDLVSQTLDIEEIYDYDEGQNAIIIKLKNLYNWAEIYVPTDIYGNGMWVQFDVNLDSYGGGGIPLPSSFNITVNSNFTAGYRGPVANLTATLSSTTNTSVQNREIIFTDYTSGLELGRVNTNQYGTASLLVDIDSSQIVGPHIILASYLSTINSTYYVVYGDIDVNLLSVNPNEVNRSITNTTRIQGYVYDPIANQRVKDAIVEFTLLQIGTNNKILNPFDIIYTSTDSNGDFDEYVNVEPSVSKGNYEIRVDFNGSWSGFPFPYPFINDSSNRIGFNITEEKAYFLLFSIDGQPTDYPFPPNMGSLINVKRGGQINLSVVLIDEDTMSPVPSEIVQFYDYTNGNIFIGSDTTNSFGACSVLYNIINAHKSGPTLVYAKYGQNRNYSYYVVNESIAINLISYTTPLEYDIATQTQFNIQCELIDTINNPIYYSQIDLRMNRSTTDYTGYITPSNPVYPSPFGSNFFNFNRGITAGIPLNNYTLKLEFYGSFDFYNYPYPAIFDLGYLYNSVEIPQELYIYDSDQVTILLNVEGNPTRTFYDDTYKPQRYNPTETAHFQVNVSHALDLDGNPLYIYDHFTNSLLDTYYFPLLTGPSGFHQFDIPLSSLHGGLHKIRIQYHTYSAINTTYIIINKTIDINANPNKNEITRGIESFVVSGTVQQGGINLRGLRISIHLLNSTYNDVSNYLNLVGSQSIIINNDGSFSFTISSIDLTCFQGQYYIRIDFNGTIRYPSGFPDVDLSDYLIHKSSSLIPINITAGTEIYGLSYYTEYGIFPDLWVDEDTVYVTGNLRWDNLTAISGVVISVSIIDVRYGTIIASNNTVYTIGGAFEVSIYIDPADPWPLLRSDTEIRVTFNPIINGMDYVESDQASIFPP
ncbi:MAG: transglutaminase domain-containing protein [Candidatus Hermodarchaeota archaeon]